MSSAENTTTYKHNSGKKDANNTTTPITPNPGVTSYNPDAIESYQFGVSARCGDLLVGINGKELVGFALEKEAPSTSFFFETLEQVARCVSICKKGNHSNNDKKKEWIVAVGGDSKFVDIYNVTLNNHVGCCQAFGRIGPFPKRIQSITTLNDEKQILLVADRFGDIYYCYATADAKPELMTKRERQSSTTPRQNSNGGDGSQNNNNNNNNNGNVKQAHQTAPMDRSNLRFALQHLGILSVMRTIPCGCNSEASPLLVSCDSDHHVRVSCGRRPGLVLQNLWPEYKQQNEQTDSARNRSSTTTTTVATAAPSTSDDITNNIAPFASTAGKTVSAISYFSHDNTENINNSISNRLTLVTGRCDGTLSAWGLVRRNVEMLDLDGTATCEATFGSNGPIVGVACLRIPQQDSSSSQQDAAQKSNNNNNKKDIVVFAKADSSRLYGWVPSLSPTAVSSPSNDENDNNANNSNNKSMSNTTSTRRDRQQELQSCFTLKQVKDSNFKKDNGNNITGAGGSSNIVALYGCSAISPTAVIVVFRDATVELFDICYSESQSSESSKFFCCRPIPFPASGSHTRVPLPFSSGSKEQISRVKADAIYSIITNQIATDEWQNKYTGGSSKKGNNNNGNENQNDDDQDEE